MLTLVNNMLLLTNVNNNINLNTVNMITYYLTY